MRLELFINFDGNCNEAVEFYAKAFKTEIMNLQTYGDAPAEHGYVTPEADRNRIMYAALSIGDRTVMFSDAPANGGFLRGNNVCPTLCFESKDEITRIYNELKEGGEAFMELQPTFFAELFAMIEDKFGVIWQLSL